MEVDAMSNVDESKDEGEVLVKKSEAVKERCIKTDPKHEDFFCWLFRLSGFVRNFIFEDIL